MRKSIDLILEQNYNIYNSELELYEKRKRRENMKRSVISVLLVLVLICVFVLSSCDSSSGKEQTAAKTENQVTGKQTTAGQTTAKETAKTEEDIQKYLSACEMLLAGNTVQAYTLFKEISDYAPAAEKLKGFFYLPETVVERWKYSDDATYRTNTRTYTYDSAGNVVKWDAIASNGYQSSREYTYDSNGNVLTGGDLLYNDDSYGTYLFTYENGRLTQLVAQNEKSKKCTTTYKYNDKGLLIVESHRYEGSESVSKTEYSYTYYTNGTVNTRSFGNPDEYYSCVEHYDENGLLTSVVYVYEPKNPDEIADAMTVEITHEANGYKKIEGTYSFDESFVVTYTYDGNGALIELEATGYEDGVQQSVYKYSFVNNRLFYNANPNVAARANIITYQNVDAVLEILY